jgi:hypothetical protein
MRAPVGTRRRYGVHVLIAMVRGLNNMGLLQPWTEKLVSNLLVGGVAWADAEKAKLADLDGSRSSRPDRPARAGVGEQGLRQARGAAWPAVRPCSAPEPAVTPAFPPCVGWWGGSNGGLYFVPALAGLGLGAGRKVGLLSNLERESKTRSVVSRLSCGYAGRALHFEI